MSRNPAKDLIDQIDFGDLIDIAAYSEVLDRYYEATGIPNGLVGPGGELITQSGWTDACLHFHRVNPETKLSCEQSNISLMTALELGKVSGSCCDNGLMDYATPLVIKGRQLATLFLGQVLNEPPDLDYFRAQAERVGLDPERYLEAIRAVPVVTREQMEAHMGYMVCVAKALAATGLARLRESRLKVDLSRSTEQRIELEDILNFSPVGISWSDNDGNIEYLNRHFLESFGYTAEQLPNLDAWFDKAYPDADYRARVVTPWLKELQLARKRGETPPPLESKVTCRDGSVRRVVVRISWPSGKWLATYTDITNHWLSDQRNRAHAAVLEMVAKGEPLADILAATMAVVENEMPAARCSILLLDDDGKRLLTAAAPSLPDFYNDAINGIEIGEGVGSCGTAAYLGKRVVVEDVMTHPYWQPYVELAKKAGVAACWSEPVKAPDGRILGTFAIYHTEPSAPGPLDLERIGFAANIAAVAISSHKVREELEHQARVDSLTGLFNRGHFLDLAEHEVSRIARYGGSVSLVMFDIDFFKQVNDTHGHSQGDRVLRDVGEICRRTFREVDLAGRLGGEEFVILMPQTDSKRASEAAERLRQAIAAQSYRSATQESFRVTASFGVVTIDGATCREDRSASVDRLLSRADAAMYQAKHGGRNRVCVSGEFSGR